MKIKLFLFIFLLNQFLFSQVNEIQSTGNLKSDFNFYSQLNLKNNLVLKQDKEKSIFLGALFSAILPGAGEFYAESYVKSAIFLALEITAWYFNISYNKKGDDQTTYFENYANQNWSVVRYAEWLNTYKSASININPNTDLKPWDRVNWDEINQTESNIKEFSHKLETFGKQQYYEMIGKYRQFVSGWSDYSGGSDYFNNVPKQMTDYASERAKANDFYNIASKAVMVIIGNHILSIANAIWDVSSYNSNIKANISMDKFNTFYFTEYYPKLNITFNF